MECFDTVGARYHPLHELGRFADNLRWAQIDGRANGTQKSIPCLSDAIVGHASGYQQCIFLHYDVKIKMNKLGLNLMFELSKIGVESKTYQFSIRENSVRTWIPINVRLEPNSHDSIARSVICDGATVRMILVMFSTVTAMESSVHRQLATPQTVRSTLARTVDHQHRLWRLAEPAALHWLPIRTTAVIPMFPVLASVMIAPLAGGYAAHGDTEPPVDLSHRALWGKANEMISTRSRLLYVHSHWRAHTNENDV